MPNPKEPSLRSHHSPRQGEPADEVRLRGPKVLVTKLKIALERIAKEHRDRIVRGVSVPAPQHRALIGRGGQNLNDLQNRHGVTVQFPGSRSYNTVGEPSNAADLADIAPEDLVKVTGPSAGVEKAIRELSVSTFLEQSRQLLILLRLSLLRLNQKPRVLPPLPPPPPPPP